MVLILATAAQATHMDYFDFNVVSLGDIGMPSSEFKGDIDGRTVALGSAWFKGAQLHGQYSGPYTPYSLYSGGNIKLTGGVYNGGIEALGNVTIQGGSVGSSLVAGSIVAGGSLMGNGGSIAGDVTLTGQNLAGNGLNIAGVVTEGMPFSPTLDLQDLGQFFLDNSSVLGAMTDTLVPAINGDQLYFSAVSGVNIVSFAGGDLQPGGSLTIDAPADAVVYINLLGSAITLDDLNIDYTGGISSASVLMNMPEATSLDLGGGHTLNILAPHADTYFATGVFEGSLIVGGLTGKGSIRQGSFSGTAPILIPEPGSLVTMLVLAALLTRSRRSGMRRSTCAR
jgi:choice-of-anchor A domain-containing protein